MMDFKPNEFFLGLVDFIAIFLPGCLLTAILLFAESQRPIQTNALYCLGLKENTSTVFWVCYVFSAYTVGYFLSSIASGLDSLSDKIRHQIYPDNDFIIKKYLESIGVDLEDKSRENQQGIENIKDEIVGSEGSSEIDFDKYLESIRLDLEDKSSKSQQRIKAIKDEVVGLKNFRNIDFEKYWENNIALDLEDKSSENEQRIKAVKPEISDSKSSHKIDFDEYKDLFLKNEFRQLTHFFFEFEWGVKVNKALELVALIKPNHRLEGAINHFQWSSTILDSLYPVAAEKANRSMAASKFFRSLVIVFLLSLLFQLAHLLPQFISIWVWLGFILLSFREYVVQRQKSIQAAYRGVITFYTLPDKFKKAKD